MDYLKEIQENQIALDAAIVELDKVEGSPLYDFGELDDDAGRLVSQINALQNVITRLIRESITQPQNQSE